MNKVIRKTASYLLIVTLVFTAFAGLQFVSSTEAQAASYPTGYPNTYKNTGVYADDIIGVAKTQVGYRENSVGTKYGYWYSPSFVGMPWCAMFVSWCANKAKVPQSAIKKYASCSAEVAWFKSIGRWHPSKAYGGDYTPKKGDVVFYRDSGSSAVSTHTGILAGLNGNYLDVIEGNATNESVTHYTTNAARTLTNKYVIGYGNPKYGQAPAVEEKEPDSYEKWQVNVDALMLRKKATTSSDKLASIGYGELLEVTKFELAGGYLWGYTNYKNKAGWCALNYCDYINGSIGGDYYQLPPKANVTKISLCVGESKKIKLTNGLGATFTSSDKNVAKVTKKGKVQGLKAGNITVKCKTKTGSVSVKVEVIKPHINKTSAISCIGDSVTLKILGVKKAVKWSSSNKKIATVNSNGKVTSIAKGTVTITAKVGSTTYKAKIKIYKNPKTYENFTTSKAIYLRKAYQSNVKLVQIPKGKTLKIKEVKYSDTLTWGKTSYKSKTGWIELNACKYKNGSFMSKVYKVRPYLAKTEKKMYLQNTYALEVKSASASPTYASLDKKVATVNSKGVVTGTKKGVTYVTATVGKTVLKCKIEVDNPIISEESVNLLKDKTKTLKVTGGNGTVIWKSLNPEIASVDVKGVVTAKKYGEATITAARNGITLKCVVKVFDPKLSSTKLSLKAGETKTLTVKQSTGEKPVWSTSAKSIVKVSSGKITAIKAGKATITCKVDGATLHCEVEVK